VIADNEMRLPRPRSADLLADTDFLARVAMLRQQLNRSYAMPEQQG
jgi:hypothetical protein